MKINTELDKKIDSQVDLESISPQAKQLSKKIDTISASSTDRFSEKLQVYNPHSIQTRCDLISSHIDEELNQKNVNFEKLQTLVYNYVSLHMRNQAKGHREYINKARDEINDLAKRIQNTHNNWTGLGLSLAGVVASVGVAFLGVRGLDAAQLNAYSITAQTVGGLSKIPDSRADGQRGMLNIQLDHVKNKESKRHESSQKDQGIAKEAKEALAELHRQANEARRAATAA